MLATPGELPEGPRWSYEFKWDGVRALVSVRSEADGGITITGRSGADFTRTYPEVVDQAERLLADRAGSPVRLDGEIVAFGLDGRPSFAALQSRMAVSSKARARTLAADTPVAFLAFDILVSGDELVLELPYVLRRELLEALPLEVPPSLSDVSGAEVLAIAQAQGLEGIVAKRRDRPYEPGRRSASWVKQPLKRRQDVVICGWEAGRSGRAGQLGALLVGVHEVAAPGKTSTGRLVYAGQVGSGFTDVVLRDLQARLAALASATPPFDLTGLAVRDRRDAHWVRPELVASVEFRHWTAEGRLRAPSYKGLRPDIAPEAVIRDTH